MGQADLIARTRKLWGQRSGRTITDEEVQGILDSMVAFAELIIDLYTGERKRDTDSGELDGSCNDAPSRQLSPPMLSLPLPRPHRRS